MYTRPQERFTTAVWILVVCTQSVLFANAAEPLRAKSRGLVFRSGFRPAQTLCVPRPACSEPDVTASDPTTRQSFKFDPDGRLIVVPVRIGGKEYPFVLDTGCGVSVFDDSLRPYLGRQIDTLNMWDPFGNGVEVDVYPPPDACVGSLPMRKHNVACRDLTELREAFGFDLRGFIGMEFLKDWITTIDFDKGRIDFLPSGTMKKPEWGESVPCIYDTKGLRICSKIGKDIEGSFEVDTGNTGTGNLEDMLVLQLVVSHEARLNGDTKCVTASGVHSPVVTRLSHFSVGSFQHDDLRFTTASANVLGLGYLSRYRVTIDFPNGQIYLAKGNQFADRDRGSMCGLGLLFKTHGIEIAYVDEKCPAYAAGVRAKDVLVDVCGTSVSVLKPSEIYRMLTAEGRPVRMAVERGGKRIEVRFTPYEYEEQPGKNGVSTKPDCARKDPQSGIPAVRPCPCRRSRPRRFSSGRLRCEVSRLGCGR